MSIVIASGYFDPIHVGHIEYLKKAAALGDKLLVIVNNDQQAYLKKGRAFMPVFDRMKIVQAIKYVDSTVLSIDLNETVCQTLRLIYATYQNEKMYFAKGGDRTAEEIPEAQICRELGIEIVDGLGPKIRSSSEIIREAPRCQENKS